MGQSERRSKARMVGLRQLLFLYSLMGLTRSQGSTPNPVTPSQGCWYEAMCAFSNDNDIQFPIPSENTDLESRMVWCYNQCQVEQNCTDFTVHGVRGGFKCYLLTNCDEKSANDACLAQETCNSGPKDCDVASNSNCDILQTPPPDTTTTWTRPPLFHNVLKVSGKPLLFIQMALAQRIFLLFQTPCHNQMIKTRLTVAAPTTTWSG